MGLIAAYTAAVRRVLIGLECCDMHEFEECGGTYGDGEESSADGPWAAIAEDLRASTGADVGPLEILRDKCCPGGEFGRYKAALNEEVVHCCERTGDYSALDALEDSDAYNDARASARAHFDRYGALSAAELKGVKGKRPPGTLAALILKVAQRQAAKMRAAELRKA
jgi:hypothetical protein